MDPLKDLAEWLRLEATRAQHAAQTAGGEMGASLQTGSAASLPSVAHSLTAMTRYQSQHDTLVAVMRQVETLRAKADEQE